MYPKEINRQDKSGKTPLHTAILSKQFHIVDKLLENGADVTIRDDAGDNPLHTAIHVGSDKLVLVSRPTYFQAPSASFQICSDTVILVVGLEFKPSLFVAITGLFKFTHYFIYVVFSLKTLLHRGGCDVGSLGRNSATPLHLAAEMDNDVICKILVRYSIFNRELFNANMTTLNFLVK